MYRAVFAADSYGIAGFWGIRDGCKSSFRLVQFFDDQREYVHAAA
jgi:hypothetical protein